MEQVYELVDRVDPIYVLIAAIILLALDIFILETAILIVVALSMILFSIIGFLGFGVEVQTWSIPILLFLVFLGHRSFISALTSQKLPYNRSRDGTFNATVKKVEDGNHATSYFYGYKDEKQSGNEEFKPDSASFRVVLEDGRSMPIDETDISLSHGLSVKVKIANNKAKVVKTYE